MPYDNVSKATVVLWGRVVDEAYDLEYPSKRFILWCLRTNTWLMDMKSGDKFFPCQLLQIFHIKFLSHGIHAGMELKWESEGILSDDWVRIGIELIVSGVAVTYQFADQVGIILRQVNAFGQPFLQIASVSLSS